MGSSERDFSFLKKNEKNLTAGAVKFFVCLEGDSQLKLSNLVDRTLLKFIMVGVVNTLFGSAIMFAMYNLLHCSYWVSSAANYICGSILSFFLNKHFTFRNQSKGASVVIKFTINIVVCYLLAYGIARPAVRFLLEGSSLRVQENLSMLAGMVLFVGFNYIGQRFFAFAEKDK